MMSNSAIYLGKYSSDTTIDVSSLNATSVNQFLFVSEDGDSPMKYHKYECNVMGYYRKAILSLSNDILTITAPSVNGQGYSTPIG